MSSLSIQLHRNASILSRPIAHWCQSSGINFFSFFILPSLTGRSGGKPVLRNILGPHLLNDLHPASSGPQAESRLSHRDGIACGGENFRPACKRLPLVRRPLTFCGNLSDWWLAPANAQACLTSGSALVSVRCETACSRLHTPGQRPGGPRVISHLSKAISYQPVIHSLRDEFGTHHTCSRRLPTKSTEQISSLARIHRTFRDNEMFARTSHDLKRLGSYLACGRRSPRCWEYSARTPSGSCEKKSRAKSPARCRRR